jgi:hypothetical protein
VQARSRRSFAIKEPTVSLGFFEKIGANAMPTVFAASMRKTSPLNPYRIETKSQGGFKQ